MLEITIDTREQTPWAFPPYVATVTVGTLTTGDYALTGDDGFAIERKSLNDFVGTIASGWARFLRETDRMDGWPAKVVIVEGDFEHLVFRTDPDGEVRHPDHDHNRISPQFVMKRIAELTMRGVSILFAHDALCACGLATAVLKERAAQIESSSTEQLVSGEVTE